MSVKVRFAPSPTGKLHVGNVRTALVNWLFAKGQGGSFVLRIDDTDLARSTQEYEDGIEADLTWLGLTWDERYNQSKRFDRYEEAAARLKASGRLYPCYETSDELDRRRKVQLSRGLPPKVVVPTGASSWTASASPGKIWRAVTPRWTPPRCRTRC